MFLGKDYFVTIHEKELKSVGDLHRSCQDNAGKREALMKSSTSLFYSVIDMLVDDMFPILHRVRTELAEIEDKVFDARVSVAIEISRQRRVIADLRRMIAPLRRLFLDITVNASRFTTEDFGKHFSDVRDHIEKAWAVLDEARETIEIYKDTDYVLSTELTNKVLAVLTIIFTLTIPATVVGSLYGMNVPLPGGLATGPLTSFGPFTSFLVLMVFALAPAIVMSLYFRRKGWL
jgi:magnesium transporter